MKEIGIGLLGFGTVGAGVVEGLQKKGDVIADRLGAKPVLRKIADLDIESDRGVEVDRSILTRDATSVIEDPDIEVIVELVGGTSAAKDYVMQALKLGKPVVTANKALLAEHGDRIFRLADERNVDIFFGASVGGGIPIVRALREGMISNQIESIYGILNGTCNYILTRMEKGQLSFDNALKEAQAEGYAEADPSLDIDGLDTAHKAVILASLAYGFMVPMSEVHVEGIRGLAESDIRYALDLGYRIKMMAIIKRIGPFDHFDKLGTGRLPPPSRLSMRSGLRRAGRAGGEVEIRVHPTLVPLDHVLASVSGVFNAVMVRGDMVGDTLYYGRGAGREPTASTVISDLADVVQNLAVGSHQRALSIMRSDDHEKIREMSEIETRYYLRLSLLDKPGMLARIASVLGNHNMSIASVLQKEDNVGNYVPVVIVTHRAKGREMDAALDEIDVMDVVGSKTVRLRIEAPAAPVIS